MPRIKVEKRDRGFAKKRTAGCEANHARHPKLGIPWCARCIKEGRCNWTTIEADGVRIISGSPAKRYAMPEPLVRMAEAVDRIISGV